MSIQWLKPCDVEPKEIQQSNGERFVIYKIKGISEPLTRYDVIHVRGFSLDGVIGKSPIRMLRESIGTSIAQTQAAGKLMKNGAKWPGFMKVLGVQKKEQLDQIRDEINSNMSGVMNAGRIPVVGGDLQWQETTGMSMTDAQFIESRRFELQEIARIFQIPSFLIGDSTSSTTWGSGIEQQTLGFLNFCLDSHLICWEQSLGMTLLTTQEINDGYFFRFDRDELINASLQARAAFYQTMRNIGVYSPNDVRAKLGEPLIKSEDGGDDYGKPLNANVSGTGEPTPAAKEEEPEPIEA
jgi:HK97 family phage portal protein